MTIPMSRIGNEGSELTVPIVGFNSIESNDTVNLGAPLKKKKSKHAKGGSGSSPPIAPFKTDPKRHKSKDDWYKHVTEDLIFASTVSTIDELEKNTIVTAESIHTINNLMNSVFLSLNLPPRIKSGYGSLGDLDKIKFLHSVIESSPDNFSRAMVNFPFYDGTEFVREIRTNDAFSNADKEAIRRDITAGLASFSYSKGQKGAINVANDPKLSTGDRRDVISTVVSNCVRSSNPEAVIDVMLNSKPDDIRHISDDIANSLIGFDRDPAKIDPESAAEITTILTNCGISDINSYEVGKYCGNEAEKVISKRVSAQPKTANCLPLSDSGWSTALMKFASTRKFDRGDMLTEEFSKPTPIDNKAELLTAERFYKSNKGLPSYTV